MEKTLAETVWAQWTAMWNGETEIAHQIIGKGFHIHLPSKAFMDPAEIHDARAVIALVDKVRGSYRTLQYQTNGEILVDGDSLVVRWFAVGVYAGKTPRPSDVAGKEFRMAGIDILRLEGDRIRECWTLSNPIEP